MLNRLSRHIRAATFYDPLNHVRHLGRVASILTCFCLFGTSGWVKLRLIVAEVRTLAI